MSSIGQVYVKVWKLIRLFQVARPCSSTNLEVIIKDGKDDNWLILNSAFDINSFALIITQVEDGKKKNIVAKVSIKKHKLLIVQNTHISGNVVILVSELRTTDADKQVNDYHCILFPDLKMDLMMRNSSLDSLAKLQDVFSSWNVIKWNPREYSIRYEELSNVHLAIYGQNVKIKSAFILNLQKAKERIQCNDSVRNVVYEDEENSSFILKDASRPYESLHGDDRNCQSYSNGI